MIRLRQSKRYYKRITKLSNFELYTKRSGNVSIEKRRAALDDCIAINCTAGMESLLKEASFDEQLFSKGLKAALKMNETSLVMSLFYQIIKSNLCNEILTNEICKEIHSKLIKEGWVLEASDLKATAANKGFEW